MSLYGNTRRTWDKPRDIVMRKAIEEALLAWAVDYLEEHGGSMEEAISAASHAWTQIEHVTYFGGNQQRWDQTTVGRKVSYSIDRIQAEVNERICAGGTYWIKCGGSLWHRVGTPTRAMCGTKINSNGRAWRLGTERPDSDLCSRCGEPARP